MSKSRSVLQMIPLPVCVMHGECKASVVIVYMQRYRGAHIGKIDTLWCGDIIIWFVLF